MAFQMTRKKWLWVLTGLVLLCIVLALIKGKSTPKGEEVETAYPMMRDIQELVSASGRINPQKEIKISSDVSGEVTKLFVKEGDTVKAGQILAQIDEEIYKSAVSRGEESVNSADAQRSMSRSGIAQVESQLEQAKVQLKNMRTTHARNKELFTDGFISKADFEMSETQLQQSEQQLRSAEAALASARDQERGAGHAVQGARASLSELKQQLRKTTIRAPQGGIISRLNIEQGERVVGTIQMSGTELMRIADFATMEVKADVSENDILRVSVGNSAQIEVDAHPGRLFKGTVTEIANSNGNSLTANLSTSTDQVTTYTVTIILDKTSYQDLVGGGKPFPFRPGMSASVEIITRVVKNVLAIPIQSLTTRDKPEVKEKNKQKMKSETEENLYTKSTNVNDLDEVVFIVHKDTVARRVVTTGIQDQDYIQVTSGLDVKEEIVVGPYSTLSRKLEGGTRITKEKKKKKTEENENK